MEQNFEEDIYQFPRGCALIRQVFIVRGVRGGQGGAELSAREREGERESLPTRNVFVALHEPT